MAVPDYQALMLPLLNTLAQEPEQAAATAMSRVARALGLSEEQQAELTPSGNQPLIANRLHWAMTYLAQAGLTARPRKGIWSLTEEGRRVLLDPPGQIDLEFLKRYEAFRAFLARERVEFDEDVDLAEDSADRPGLPMIDDLLDPFLRVIEDEKVHLLSKVVDRVADRLDLNQTDRERRIPSGRTIIENRVGWARTSLVRAGLIEQPKASTVQLTSAGKVFLRGHREPIDGDVLKRECPSYAAWLADMGEIPVNERSDRSGPTVWMVRAGERGAYTNVFIDESAVMLGWGAAGNISGLTAEVIAERVAHHWPDYRRHQRGQAANALFRFATDMRSGDIVVTPEPASRTILLGEISGKYEYREPPTIADYAHIRPVKWFARVARSELSYGARNSLSTQISLSRPAHEEEMLRLASAHRSDDSPQPLAKTPKSPATPKIPEVVAIASTATPPERSGLPKADPVSRELIQLLSQLDIGQLALPNFQRTFVWAPDETRELIVSMIRSFPAGALLFGIMHLTRGHDSLILLAWRLLLVRLASNLLQLRVQLRPKRMLRDLLGSHLGRVLPLLLCHLTISPATSLP